MADGGDLVERLAEHFWKFGWNAVECEAPSGSRDHCAHLARLALESLGLEYVTKLRQPHPPKGRITAMQASEMWMDGFAVYRIAPPNGSTPLEATDAH